jgi:hypothetical protein
MIEQRRRDGGVTGLRETIGDVADMAVHAKDFLDYHDAAFRFTGRLGQVGVDGGVAAFKLDELAHGCVLSFEWWKLSSVSHGAGRRKRRCGGASARSLARGDARAC